MSFWKQLEALFQDTALKEELALCYQARHQDQDRLKELRRLNTQLNEKYKGLWQEYQEYKLKIETKPSVHDAEYWDNKWKRNRITYKAPHTRAVQDYVKYRQIDGITEIVAEIMQNYAGNEKNPDQLVKLVQAYRDEVFYLKNKFKYKRDKTEKWNTPEETLQNNNGDCDDVGILFYYIIRELFVRLGLWDSVRHRLKCAAGNVNVPGKIPAPAGGHFYLLWLGSSGQWYPVESTYYMDLSRRKFLEMPQKADPMYGKLWFTFNEHWSWAQQDIHNDTFDWRKKK